MSGRKAPSSPTMWSCSVKSQCSTIPESSTIRRSVISPQRPRTSGRRRAVTRLRVSRCSCAWPPASPSICVRRVAKAYSALALNRSPNLLFGARQRGFQWLDQLRDRCFALLETRTLGNGLIATQRLARESQEHLAVRAQRFAPRASQRPCAARFSLLQRGDALAFFLQFGQARRARSLSSAICKATVLRVPRRDAIK